jgi:hypothetical protein
MKINIKLLKENENLTVKELLQKMEDELKVKETKVEINLQPIKDILTKMGTFIFWRKGQKQKGRIEIANVKDGGVEFITLDREYFGTRLFVGQVSNLDNFVKQFMDRNNDCLIEYKEFSETDFVKIKNTKRFLDYLR